MLLGKSLWKNSGTGDQQSGARNRGGLVGSGHAHVRNAHRLTAMVHEGPSKVVRAFARCPSGDPEERFGSFGVYYWGAADEEPIQETWHPRGTPGLFVCFFFFGRVVGGAMVDP